MYSDLAVCAEEGNDEATNERIIQYCIANQTRVVVGYEVEEVAEQVAE